MEQEKKPKILIAHNYYQIPGGEDSVVANEKRMLEKNGHKVILYSRNNSEIKRFSVLKKAMLPFASIFSVKAYTEVKHIIKKEKIDVLHVHNTLSLISPSIYYAALSCKIPVVQTIHNFRLICPNALLYRDGHICEDCLQHGLKCALKHKCYRDSFFQTLVSVCILKFHRLLGIYGKINYVCLTEFNREKLLNLEQIGPRKIFIKPNFVESSGKVIPFEQRKKQFIFIGRPEKIKGLHILLEAWRQIKEYDLLICGTSNEIEWCKNYIIEYELKNVHVLGKVDNAEVRKIMAESLALILPTQLYEGFPMTLVEAFSCGTPVIGSNIGNVQRLIVDGKNGLLFQYDSSADLINKVYECAKLNVVNVCFDRYCKFYDEESNYAILRQIYSAIMR